LLLSLRLSGSKGVGFDVVRFLEATGAMRRIEDDLEAVFVA
jgi:hypothetical protein